MSHIGQGSPETGIIDAIFFALNACYGDLANADFRTVYVHMDGPLHRRIRDKLRTSGVAVTETTDRNDDVSTQLVASHGSDQVGLALSGVGPFAALIQLNRKGGYRWVTTASDAQTAFVALIAHTVEQEGFILLGRDTVVQTVSMARADGSTTATLYQALFTNSDFIP